jgi:hypothetical protein
MRVPSTRFEQMNLLLVNFEVLHFHICLYFVQPQLHPLGFGSLTSMVALAEPSLRVLPMAPKPFAIWFINLVVSWFCVGASLC